MNSNNRYKYLFLMIVFVAAGLALADALGFFNPKPYTEVHHGSIIHYVPDNRDPTVSIERFPTQKPGPDQIITPTGQIIKKSEWEEWQNVNSTQTFELKENAPDESIRTIDMVGNDNMRFVVKKETERIRTAEPFNNTDGKSYLLLKQIEAEPGEAITIRLKTVSRFNPEMMSHNWVLLDGSVDADTFVAESNRGNNFIPAEREESIIAYTELAGDGEIVEVTFIVPSEPGEYEYLCSFLAHYAAGMKGQLIVQQKEG